MPGWREREGNSSANRTHFLKGSFVAHELSNTQERKETPHEPLSPGDCLLPRRLCSRATKKDRERLVGEEVCELFVNIYPH